MNYDEEMKRNAFKPIKENPIILDFTGCKYLGEIHLILKEKFGLPDYYGENWDALWDCLDGLFFERGFYLVEIHGLSSVKQQLHDECELMLRVFDGVHRETPNVEFILIS